MEMKELFHFICLLIFFSKKYTFRLQNYTPTCIKKKVYNVYDKKIPRAALVSLNKPVQRIICKHVVNF